VRASRIRSLSALGNLVQKAAPYLLIEMLLPGGTLFALALILHRRVRLTEASSAAEVSVLLARALSAICEEIACMTGADRLASVWRGRHRERDGLEALAMLPTVW